MASQTVVSSSSYRYSVIRYLVDPKRDISVPAGVLLWCGKEQQLRFRVPKGSDRIPELRGEAASVFINDTVKRLSRWISEKRIPFSDRALTPDDDAWWDLAQQILHHRVRLTAPVPVDCVNPEVEADLLFDAAVSPRAHPRRTQRRVDSAITKCLGKDLRDQFRRGAATPGYRQHDATVIRLYESKLSRVVIEGINLATPDAPEQAYRLVGKAEWLREGDKPVEFVVGYLATSIGLNGEAVYKDWIEERLDTKCFDLQREGEEFDRAVRSRVPAAQLFEAKPTDSDSQPQE